MVAVAVVHMALLRERRDDDHRNARAIPEEVDGLDITRVVIAAAFIHRDENRRLRPELLVAFHPADDVLHEFFVAIHRRVRRVTGHAFEGADEGHCRHAFLVAHVLVELGHVLEIVLERGGHD